jgi:hypothetical protein
MMFQHIIVPEIYDALVVIPNVSDISVEANGKHYILDPTTTRAGALSEAPCPSNTNSGQFDAVVNQGDVVAMCFGHDHVNSFVVEHKGVDLINTPGAGFSSYGDKNRGVRIIDIKEGTTDYETKVVTYKGFYEGNAAADARFVLYGSEHDVANRIGAFFEYVLLCISEILGLVK